MGINLGEAQPAQRLSDYKDDLWSKKLVAMKIYKHSCVSFHINKHSTKFF
jgi:hypothetical protein